MLHHWHRFVNQLNLKCWQGLQSNSQWKEATKVPSGSCSSDRTNKISQGPTCYSQRLFQCMSKRIALVWPRKSFRTVHFSTCWMVPVSREWTELVYTTSSSPICSDTLKLFQVPSIQSYRALHQSTLIIPHMNIFIHIFTRERDDLFHEKCHTTQHDWLTKNISE